MITAWENATAQHSVLDKGYIELIDYMPHPATGVSGDLAIVNAARVSFMGQTKGEDADKKLLFYLLKHQHTSPFEQVQFKFRVKAPVLVWWQWVRHRTFHFQSINSQSGRYTPFREDEFYFPREWRAQSADNKQGSEGVISEQRERLIYARATLNFPDNHWLATEFLRDEDEDDPTLSQVLARYNRLGYQIYEKLLESGVAKEQARLFLPGFGVYYTWVISVDALNLMNFLRLRMADDAQWEIRQYADIIYKEMFKPLLPWTAEAFEQFVLKAGE